MPTQVYNTEKIALQDDTEVTLRPLVIAKLKRFMTAWEEITKLPDGDDGIDVLINCAGIALESNFKGKFESLRANKEEQENGEFLSAEYREYLEETLDTPTIYKILEVCGNIKLDPKAIEAAVMQEMQSQE